MLDRRYQVFVATSGLDMSPERRIVAQTLIGIGFSSWCVEHRTPVSTAIARRQIDESDYVVILLGSKYGDCSVSGVSYMHLEYIYAITKQKPIIVFIHADPRNRPDELQETSLQAKEKFNNFRKQLQHEVDQVFFYRDLRDLELIVRANMLHMLECFPVLGWIRPQNMQILQDRIDALNAKVNQLERELKKCEHDMVAICDVSVEDIYCFRYRIQAYQDGYVHEMEHERSEDWGQLLYVLSKVFKTLMPEECFAKCLNDYLNETALAELRITMPQVYAVGRAQIQVQHLYHIKLQMRQNEWILPAHRDERHRMLWTLSSKAHEILETYIQQQNRNFQLNSNSYSNL